MKLASYLNTKKLKHREFADLIGVSQAAVSRYANGERVPRPSHMRAIQAETGGAVTPNDFLDAAPTPSSDQSADAEASAA